MQNKLPEWRSSLNFRAFNDKKRGTKPTITTPYGCKSHAIASVKSIIQFQQLHINTTHDKKPAVFPFLQKGWDDHDYFQNVLLVYVVYPVNVRQTMI